jgi:HEAT repeat protein
MSAPNLTKAAVALAAGGAMASTSHAAKNDKAVRQLVTVIKGDDPDARAEAWMGSAAIGAAAVEPLAAVMAEEESGQEARLAAKRALWRIVRHVGGPEAESRAKSQVISKLHGLLVPEQLMAVRREALAMLSEIGGRNSAGPIAALLSDPDAREDARMALERIPGTGAVKALKSALEEAPDDFKPAIAQSLRARGQKVKGLPCQKLVPTKQTDVKPLEEGDIEATEKPRAKGAKR